MLAHNIVDLQYINLWCVLQMRKSLTHMGSAINRMMNKYIDTSSNFISWENQRKMEELFGQNTQLMCYLQTDRVH